MDEHVITDKRKQIMLIALVSLVSFMITLDYTSLNISLPSIAQYFGVKVGLVAWLPTIYLLIITSSLLGFGKLGDNIGYKKVFMLGVGIFGTGAVLCAISPNFTSLFISRAFQSIGQAMYSPICIALLTYYLPAGIKGRALGIYATMQGMGLAAGPAVGGLMISMFNWRANFMMAIPLCILILFFSWKYIPSRQSAATDKRFDYTGAVLLFLGLAGFIYAINSVARAGLTDPMVLFSIAVAGLGFALFVLQEKKVAYPLLDFKLFSNLNFTFASLAALFGLAMYIGMVFLLPFFLQMMLHFKVAQAGLIMMTPSLMMMILAPFTGSLSDLIGSRRLCMGGMALATLAFVMISFISPQTSIIFLILVLICLGVGMGCFMAPNNRLIMQNAPADKQGVASGVYKIALNAGSSIGIALYMLVMSYVVIFDVSRMHILLNEVRQHPDIMLAGFRGAFMFGILMAVCAFIFSYLAKDKA
ncbi:MAG: MFS transporter [Syntrophales bacterium]|nr:MFS transporter [Syntrophales bacterium]